MSLSIEVTLRVNEKSSNESLKTQIPFERSFKVATLFLSSLSSVEITHLEEY